MPIRINLLAEAQAAEDARRRDPVKRAIWAGGFLVFLMLAWTGVLQLRIIAANSETGRQQARWKEIEDDHKEVQEIEKELVALQRRLAALDRLSTNRFLWANVLEALQHTVIDDIQLTRIRAEQSYRYTEAVVPRRGVKAPQKAEPAKATERIIIHLEGRDFNSVEQNFNAYRIALAEYPFFEELLSRPDAFRLTSLSQPAANPANPARSSVTFSLECRFPEVVRHE